MLILDVCLQQREQQRHVDRVHGKEVICEQIAARERERLMQQGVLEQERDAMLRQLERLKEEDLLKSEMKKEAAKKLMEEVLYLFGSGSFTDMLTMCSHLLSLLGEGFTVI